MRIESQSSISLQKSETDRNILGKDDFLKLLIGLQVKVDKGDGTVDEGTVEAVRFSTAGPVIMVNGKDYLITDLIEISK